MTLLTFTFYAWAMMLVLKAVGFPGIKELTWGQLFMIPVLVFLVRLLLIIGWWILIILGILMIWWFTGWAVTNLDLPTGYR